ncbi:hypothetical protein [Pseudomonas syringae]|uniref:hypothetical protein n=1 Tax=Pseudomonas syringae TaxID=317 RepID=UPI003F74B14B
MPEIELTAINPSSLQGLLCMFNWFRRKKSPTVIPLYTPGADYKDLPGSLGPSVDDVRYEALEFEKMVKGYIERKTGKWPKHQSLASLIKDELPKFDMHPEIPELWPKFVAQAIKLNTWRNKIVHSDLSNVQGLPDLPELYEQFRSANTMLRPFGFVGSRSRDRFSGMCWKGPHLHFKIDETPYILNARDIGNLLSELHPSSRGKVHFQKGKLVGSKVRDFRYERHTFYIEDCEPFELTEEESMALQDLLICFLGNHELEYRV